MSLAINCVQVAAPATGAEAPRQAGLSCGEKAPASHLQQGDRLAIGARTGAIAGAATAGVLTLAAVTDPAIRMVSPMTFTRQALPVLVSGAVGAVVGGIAAQHHASAFKAGAVGALATSAVVGAVAEIAARGAGSSFGALGFLVGGVAAAAAAHALNKHS